MKTCDQSPPLATAGVRPSKLKPIVAAIVAGAICTPATAADFSFGETTGSLNTTVSYGALWRMEDADPRLIGIANGGRARSVNGDNGNLNYESNDIVNSIIKTTNELTLSYGNFDLFARGFASYDFAAADNEEYFGERGQDRLEFDSDFLDLFINGTFDTGTTARLGWQVINWGESTFIQNGISITNAVDVSKLRSPGSELREALIPTPMFWVSQTLTDNLSFEGYAQFAFDEVKLDPKGAFFSTTDTLSDDATRTYLTYGRRKDDNFDVLTNPIPPSSSLYALSEAYFGPFDGAASVWIERQDSVLPDDGLGQYGLALRYFSQELNNTEFALYYVNYHSRTPIYSIVKSDRPLSTIASGTATGACSVLTGVGTDVTGDGQADDITGDGVADDFGTLTGQNCSAGYFSEYPEDIRLLGLSFNTSAPFGVAVQGEYSYRENLPLQIAGVEMVQTAVNVPSAIAPDPNSVAPGSVVHGYERVEQHQIQTTLTKTFAQAFWSEQVVALAEVGYTHLELPGNTPFDGPGVALPFPGTGAEAGSGGSVQETGYATEDSWGYRLLFSASYPDLLRAVNVTPRVAWSHDVHGVSPTFNQDAQALTFGTSLAYQNSWGADLSYTNFFGGRNYCGTDDAALSGGALAAGQPLDYCTSANPLKDRDFLALTVSYSF